MKWFSVVCQFRTDNNKHRYRFSLGYKVNWLNNTILGTTIECKYRDAKYVRVGVGNLQVGRIPGDKKKLYWRLILTCKTYSQNIILWKCQALKNELKTKKKKIFFCGIYFVRSLNYDLQHFVFVTQNGLWFY